MILGIAAKPKLIPQKLHLALIHLTPFHVLVAYPKGYLSSSRVSRQHAGSDTADVIDVTQIHHKVCPVGIRRLPVNPLILSIASLLHDGVQLQYLQQLLLGLIGSIACFHHLHLI